MDLSKTESLIKLNNISETEFDEKLYNTLVLGVFEVLCKNIEKQGKFSDERIAFRKFSKKNIAAVGLVKHYVGCTLTEDGYDRMGELLAAHFSAGDKRKPFDQMLRDELARRQNGKCVVCKKVLDPNDAHVDHIVPYSYVGDCLSNNYQLLCGTCNTRKGNSTYFEFSMLLLNKG